MEQIGDIVARIIRSRDYRMNRTEEEREAYAAARKEFYGPSLTMQEFKEETEMSNILAKYRKTGQLPAMIKKDPKYGDFSDVPNYQEALARVAFAQEQFMALPAKVRAKFDNNPSEFLKFAQDPKNEKEMIELGLKEQPPNPGPNDDGTGKEIPPSQPETPPAS